MATLILLCALFAQTIELKPGAPAITVEGDASKGKDATFHFQGKAGSKFSAHMTSRASKAGFEITGPNGEGIPEAEYDFNADLKGTLPVTGEYKINVATFEVRPVHFKLTVRVY